MRWQRHARKEGGKGTCASQLDKRRKIGNVAGRASPRSWRTAELEPYPNGEALVSSNRNHRDRAVADEDDTEVCKGGALDQPVLGLQHQSASHANELEEAVALAEDGTRRPWEVHLM